MANFYSVQPKMEDQKGNKKEEKKWPTSTKDAKTNENQ